MTEHGLRKQLELTALQAQSEGQGAGSSTVPSRSGVLDPIGYSKRFQAFLSEHVD
jgi:hypothetical protein